MNVLRVKADKLFETVSMRLEQVDLLLDIGCGIRPQQLVRPMTHICFEPCSEYVSHLQAAVAESFDRNYLVINAGWQQAVRFFPPGSVDTVILVDVIEHLEKEEALALLQATVCLARRQVAVFTPLGFMPQSHDDGKDAWGLGGGVWQEHRSGWYPEDFGDEWGIFLSESFHVTDNTGNPLVNPFGAFWAIWTNPEPASERTPGRQAVRSIYDIAAAFSSLANLLNMQRIVRMLAQDFSPSVSVQVLSVLRLGLKIKQCGLFRALHQLFY